MEKQEVIEQIVKDILGYPYINIEDYDLHWNEYTIENKVYTRDELISFLQRCNEITELFFAPELKETFIKPALKREVVRDLLGTFAEVYTYDHFEPSKDEELTWRFSCFLDSLPNDLKNILPKAVIQAEFTKLTDNYTKFPKNTFKSSDEDFYAFIIYVIYVFIDIISIEKIFESLFPELFFQKEKKLMANKYEESKSDLHFYEWFINKYDDRIQKYIDMEFQGSKLQWKEYVKYHITDRMDLNSFFPLSLRRIVWVFFVWITNSFRDHYNQWLNKVLMERQLNIFARIDIDNNSNIEICFFYYYWLNNKNWECFFEMINSDFLNMDEYKHILAQLKEQGLGQYVQKRYDEYRRITGRGRDIPFAFLLNVSEVSKAMSVFFNKEVTNEELETFTNVHLPLIIKETVSKLKASDNSLNVVGFALVLWKSKYFNKNYFNRDFSKFRDEIIKIFQFSCSTKYTEGNTKLVNAAKKLWTHDPILNAIITSKEINSSCTHKREEQRKKYEKMREERKKQKTTASRKDL